MKDKDSSNARSGTAGASKDKGRKRLAPDSTGAPQQPKKKARSPATTNSPDLRSKMQSSKISNKAMADRLELLRTTVRNRSNEFAEFSWDTIRANLSKFDDKLAYVVRTRRWKDPMLKEELLTLWANVLFVLPLEPPVDTDMLVYWRVLVLYLTQTRKEITSVMYA